MKKAVCQRFLSTPQFGFLLKKCWVCIGSVWVTVVFSCFRVQNVNTASRTKEKNPSIQKPRRTCTKHTKRRHRAPKPTQNINTAPRNHPKMSTPRPETTPKCRHRAPKPPQNVNTASRNHPKMSTPRPETTPKYQHRAPKLPH